MTVSYNWLKQYLDFTHSPEELADILTDIGLEVESIESFQSVKGGLRGLVVGHVLEVVRHPDADKLQVTKIDVGLAESLQIVCGAPNVGKGQKVVVALVGTILYPLIGEPFEIKKAKIRGVESMGMICAEDEIGLGNSHDGIIVLPENTTIGTKVADLYGVENDTIFEIGLTPNRADAFSHFGVARDLSAAINFREKKTLQLKKPESNLTFPQKGDNPIDINIENKVACPRYCGVTITGITVKESPQWLKNRLISIGAKPINNIVDITNYVLHEYGQPLHAFDLSTLIGNKIVVKNLPEGTKFLTLDGLERKLSANDLMICSGGVHSDNSKEGMCIAGVYGGLGSGVNNKTTSIFLESAYFDPKTIRKTSLNHGLRTDAASHFEKGIDPNITIDALKRAVSLIMEIAGGTISSPIYDFCQTDFPNFPVNIKWRKINQLIGTDISKEEAKTILNLLEITILSEDENGLSLLVPPYRADVKGDVDVIEEILRIYGFNRVPIPTKLNASINITSEIDRDKIQQEISTHLAATGFMEMMANSITKSKYLVPEDNLPEPVKLLSSINVELDILRPTMLWSGLEAIQYNLNHKNNNCKLFEIGKTYSIQEGNYQETNHLTLLVSGLVHDPSWNSTAFNADFYYLKSIIANILSKLGIESFSVDEGNDPAFDYSLQYSVGNKVLVTFGKVSNVLLKRFDIKQAVYFSAFNWDNVLENTNFAVTYKETPKFPSVRRDLALLLDENIHFGQVKEVAIKTGKKILKEINIFDIYRGEKVGEGKKSYAVSFIFQDENKTLVDSEVEIIMKKLEKQFGEQLGASIR